MKTGKQCLPEEVEVEVEVTNTFPVGQIVGESNQSPKKIESPFLDKVKLTPTKSYRDTFSWLSTPSRKFNQKQRMKFKEIYTKNP